MGEGNGNDGLTGGIEQVIYGITINEAKNVSVAASENKVYFWFPDYKFFLIFDQRLRKWTKELQPEDVTDELYYTTICDSYNDLNFSQTPQPIYALTANGTIYELTGGKKEADTYTRTYGQDEFVDEDDMTYKKLIPFYLKTKEFKNGVLSKRKSLSTLWFNYDLEGTVNIKVITDDGRTKEIKNALPEGINQTKDVLIPNELQNVNSYTFEIYGEGDITIYAMERIDRTHLR